MLPLHPPPHPLHTPSVFLFCFVHLVAAPLNKKIEFFLAGLKENLVSFGSLRSHSFFSEDDQTNLVLGSLYLVDARYRKIGFNHPGYRVTEFAFFWRPGLPKRCFKMLIYSTLGFIFGNMAEQQMLQMFCLKVKSNVFNKFLLLWTSEWSHVLQGRPESFS